MHDFQTGSCTHFFVVVVVFVVVVLVLVVVLVVFCYAATIF